MLGYYLSVSKIHQTRPTGSWMMYVTVSIRVLRFLVSPEGLFDPQKIPEHRIWPQRNLRAQTLIAKKSQDTDFDPREISGHRIWLQKNLRAQNLTPEKYQGTEFDCRKISGHRIWPQRNIRAQNLTPEKSQGGRKAQHVTVTHPFGDSAPLCFSFQECCRSYICMIFL